MSTVNAAARLRAVILGIRPSLVYAPGLSAGLPADNLTEPGVEAWRTALGLLAQDLERAGEVSPRDRWIRDWVGVELGRDSGRWRDASSTLRLLALALGPGEVDIPAGRAFWGQWERNLAHLDDLLGAGAATPTADTAELAEHCVELVAGNTGPAGVMSLLAGIVDVADQVGVVQAVRPLASEVERIYLADVIAASFSTTQVCRAAEERFYNPGSDDSSRVCTAGRGQRNLQSVGPRFRIAD